MTHMCLDRIGQDIIYKVVMGAGKNGAPRESLAHQGQQTVVYLSA